MQWANFLVKEAAINGLSPKQTAAFAKDFKIENLSKSEAKLASELNVDIAAFRKWMGEVYDKFAQNYRELATFNGQDKLEKLQAYLRAKYNSELDVLKPLAAMKLLKSLIGRERLQQEAWIGRKICKFLRYLPLALELVGRYLNKMLDLSLKTVLKRLEKKRVEHESVVNANSLMHYEYGVAEVFELSWEQLDENAQSFGCLLSLCALADIPLSVETIGDDKKQRLNEKAIADLLQLHLLEQESKGIYRLNPLIRQLFQMKLDKSGEADEAKTKFAVMMLEVAKLIPQQPNPEDILNLTPHIPHIIEVAIHLSQYLSDENLITLFTKLAWFYQGQGLYQQAELWLQQCVDLTRNRLGLEHTDVATNLNNLAGLYESTGRYREAEPLYKQALELQKRLLGDNHLDVSTSLNNLAQLYESTERYSKAEPLYQQALELSKRLLGEAHPDVAISLNNLAALYRHTRRYKKAQPLFEQALKICEQTLGISHSTTMTIRANYASFLREAYH
ncbi:tetratricopeptide repeat protein [uncultured Nostoc sp.]|uniref:tetratricopeptide repeat protein n=1 Tax=uncultured Nostoc sp. TaxID=340711 RepID=UPI00262C1AF8|nr:tetratricopeptide repeat protein [uncultured Nostoc sp.]